MKIHCFLRAIMVLAGVTVLLFACNKEGKIEEDSQFFLKSCSSEAELSQFNDDKEIIHYKVARYLAYEELEISLADFIEVKSGSYRLTTLPVIIYDYDSRPKFYEFGLLIDGIIVKTITTIAKKEATNIVSFLFNSAVEHHANGYKFFAGNYPAVFYGIPSSSGNSPKILLQEDGKTPLTKAPSCNILDNYAEIIAAMDDESRENHQTTISDMQKEIAEFTDGLDLFWNTIDEKQDKILQMKDDEILADLKSVASSSKGPSSVYIIPRYQNTRLQRTFWNGWCGPSAIAWIYRGLYANYPKTSSNYIRIKGDRDDKEFCENGAYAFYDADAENISVRADFGLYMRLRKSALKRGNIILCIKQA